jgi:hypothetical protein
MGCVLIAQLHQGCGPESFHLREYIRWRNTARIPAKLKGLVPVQYRNQALAALILCGQSAFRGPVQNVTLP